LNNPSRQRELLRQQQLLRALWQRGAGPSLKLWLRESHEQSRHALAAYRGNAAATAERALASAFPTVQQLIGDESFALLARALWHHAPPQRGDLACWGDTLPEWLERDTQLADEPYLADVARVDWAVHTIEQAADAEPPVGGLGLLAEHDPLQLRLRLRPGLMLVSSRWPVVTIWQAHQRADADRFAPVRAAFAAGTAEHALIARSGWRAQVDTLDAGDAAFTAALLRGASLGHALDQAGGAFAFDSWLQRALAAPWLQTVEHLHGPRAAAPC
jgi:hypothetical protein